MGVLIAIGTLVNSSYAKIDSGTLVGMRLFGEGEGETVSDSSGNGRNGELVGDVKWAKGKLGSGLEFLGGHVLVPHEYI